MQRLAKLAIKYYNSIEMIEFGILHHERLRLEHQLEQLAVAQHANATVKAEAMDQSSETYHDNAPVDAANLEARRIAGAGKEITRALSRIDQPYPDPESDTIQIGSFATLSIWGDVVGAALVGNSSAYYESDFIGIGPEVTEVVIVSPESLLGTSLRGLRGGDTSKYSTEDGVVFTFNVIAIDQTLIRDHLDTPL